MRRREPQGPQIQLDGEFFPSKSKSIQTNPNRTKRNSLDLFGFIRPNLDFSMGYSESKQKFSPPVSTRLQVCGPAAQARIARIVSPKRGRRTGCIRSGGISITYISVFAKTIQHADRQRHPAHQPLPNFPPGPMALTGFAGLGWLGACGSGDERPPEADMISSATRSRDLTEPLIQHQLRSAPDRGTDRRRQRGRS